MYFIGLRRFFGDYGTQPTAMALSDDTNQGEGPMNRIIYLVGLVVIVVAIVAFVL